MSKITDNIEIQEFIKNNYTTMTDRELSKELSIPKSTIQNYRVKNNLNKTKLGLESFERLPFEILVETEFKGYYISNYGRLINLTHNYVLQPQVKRGYKKFCITYKNKDRYLLLHRLLAKGFIPQNNQSRDYINHRDGNKLNNNLLNLEWCTIEENNTHAHKNNLINYKTKISEQEVREIILLINEGNSMEEILYHVPNATKSIYHHIKSKKRWKHLKHLMKW